MSTQDPEGTTWGEPQPAQPKNWTGRKTAVAAGVAVVIAAAGGVAIWAGTSASGQESGPGGRGGFGGPPGMMAGGAAALRDAVHGDFVVSDGKGGYTTERLQTGQVTAISATSITTASKDGYTQTYAIDTTTRKVKDPKTGDTVTVVAKVSGNTATATTISEGSLGGGSGRRGQQGQRPPGTP
ncbi:hypothetical protein [Amycolatopsis sp. CA-230715]|uniref:hypothetical protein n=1 Tax=Amycolatopsis sp. CA-230715 TaxID=2745196 RepID=UPI001C00F613|nr:hypothetical protein [Amycolatopsis sp. CA-230715]QWF81292.1 hypothetical protein HUW46_04722 [Amycolatopsis sp. CA-230715]